IGAARSLGRGVTETQRTPNPLLRVRFLPPLPVFSLTELSARSGLRYLPLERALLHLLWGAAWPSLTPGLARTAGTWTTRPARRCRESRPSRTSSASLRLRVSD